MKRYLIINADDFGLCHSANEAVMELFEGGYIRSSTIMTPCPGAEEAVAFAVLANECVHGHPNNLCSVTGAAHPVVMGKISV